MMKKEKLNCRQCSNEFKPKNKRQVYCSPKCRTKACRVRHGKNKLCDLIRNTNSGASNLLASTTGSILGNTLQEFANPKATQIAQKRIEQKQDYILEKVETIEENQMKTSISMNSNPNVKRKASIFPKTPKYFKTLEESENDEDWWDRNMYWVMPVTALGLIYVIYKIDTTYEIF